MASADDPPYLTVGTEVSAKYRGAFCEATIKIAKKLVKCKVSYGKGQSVLVTSDFIKGHLKVGGQVEVKQPDGHFQQASITKLTDHSTYTVVFDDGDERTLKRSSLCLKGGRHFHESESLDHLPLTDPENFGAPVMNTSRKRRGSHSPSSSPAKRRCTYPSEFPVGKAVFLVNDRRRSSWLPAVIVPAHYVLEASEMTPDTICLRSFKDGRYFAATKNELQEFSPCKEPLLSMLEGEIPAMYMCKPAIERAMAYIDTGELPWDMDLLDSKAVRPTPTLASDPSTSDDDDQQRNKDELLMAEFEVSFQRFHESRGSISHRQPTIGPHDLNLFQLYRLVKGNGGMDKVTQEMKWRSLYLQLGLPLNSTASQGLRQAYRKYLYQFELHENKVKSGSGGLSRHSKPHPPSSDEDQDTSNTQQDQSNRTRQQDKLTPQDKVKHKLKQQDKLKRQDKVAGGDVGGTEGEPVGGKEPKGKVNGVEKGRKVALAQQRTVKSVKMEKLPSKPPLKQLASVDPEEEEGEKSDGKSEGGGSDMEEPSTGSNTNSSWNGEDMELDCSTSLSHLERSGLEQCPEGYKVNDRVLVLYGKGKTLLTYEAKVMDSVDKRDYLVHYNGWNTRYDEWIDSSRIAGKLTGSTKSRPFHSKRKKAPKSHSSTSFLFTPSTVPPPSPANSSYNAPTFSTSNLVLNSSPSSCKVAVSPSSPAKLVLSPPPHSSSSSPSSKLVLSPSLQAIISGHTQQHTKVLKKEKGYDSISGKDISSRPPLSLKSSMAPKAEVRVPVRRTPRFRGLKPGVPRSKDTLDILSTTSTSMLDGLNRGDVSSTTSNSSSAPTSPTTPTTKEFLSPLPIPSSEDDDQPTSVKQEENHLWSAIPPSSPPPPATPPPTTDSATPSSVTPVSNCLPPDGSPPPSSPCALSLAEPAAQSLLSLSTATFPSLLRATTTHLQENNATPMGPSGFSLSLGPLPSPKGAQESDGVKAEQGRLENMEASGSEVDSLAALECAEQKSLDSASGSDKEDSPVPHEKTSPASKSCQSSSPDSKRKWHRHEESSEEYEGRKRVRHAGMVYTVDFSQLSPMSRVDRVLLIQERLKEVQKCWTDLKAEVTYIERKRRRVRRKEREATQSAAQPIPALPPSSCPPSDPSPPHKPQLAAIPVH